MKIILNNEYFYNDIIEFAKNNNFEVEEIGNYVGSSFIVLQHEDKDITISFVLTGANTKNYVYKLIYSDF